MVGKFCAADDFGAGDIFHLGGIGDLSAKAVLFNDKNSLACPQAVNCSSQTGRATAYNYNIVYHIYLSLR